MEFNFSNILRTDTRKSGNKPTSAGPSLDRPNTSPKSYAQILKGSTSPMLKDPAVRAFLTNNAYKTRLGGMKPW